jgi:hypothetical protein
MKVMKPLQVFGWLYIGLAIAIGPASAKPGKGGGGGGGGGPDSKPAMQAPAQKEVSAPTAAPMQPKAGPAKEPLVAVKVSITPDERKVIQGYMSQPAPAQPMVKHGKPLPKGLAKRGKPLPPGWQKKCVPGKIMAPAVFEVAQPLPPALVVKLPPPPPGVITVTVEGKVVRLLQATHEILDVFDVHVRL